MKLTMNDEKPTEALAGEPEPAPEKIEAPPDTPPAPPPVSEVKIVDKRRFARLLKLGAGTSAVPAAEFGDEASGQSAERLPSYVAELKERAERAQIEARAEIEAARARLERHYDVRLASARADLVVGVLGVLDNLERALAAPGAAESALYEGILATRDLFLKTLAGLGAEFVPSVGHAFDPEIHEAVDEVFVDDPEADGRVVVEMQRGFRMGDRLIRPAVVRVGRAAPSRDEAEPPEAGRDETFAGDGESGGE
jgi:molecular chaperone GrpE